MFSKIVNAIPVKPIVLTCPYMKAWNDIDVSTNNRIIALKSVGIDGSLIDDWPP
jgi:hypothetical protein